MNKKGFTLIELLIVVAIIGILAVIAIPAYLGQQKSATRTEAYTNLQNLRLIEEQVFADSGCYPSVFPWVCPSGLPITIGAAGSTRAIRNQNYLDVQTVFPRFQPAGTVIGPPPLTLNEIDRRISLNYSYRIIQNVSMTNPNTVPWDLATAAQTPCFIAVATGVDNTKVVGDIFAIDCNNNKNF